MRAAMEHGFDIWANPSDPAKEFQPQQLEKLPKLNLVNLTGGEPFVREDLEEIVRVLFTKTDRVCISNSGWFEDRIIKMSENW